MNSSRTPKLNNEVATIEDFALILEAIRAINQNDEVQALRAMVAVSRGLQK